MKKSLKQIAGVVAALCAVSVLIAASPHNGIQGKAVVVGSSAGGPVMIPVQTSFTVTWIKTGRQVANVTTDADGAFGLALQPGIYALLPAPVHYGSCVLTAGPIAVVVNKKEFTPVTISYTACPNP
jgi:hypothetical protein